MSCSILSQQPLAVFVSRSRMLKGGMEASLVVGWLAPASGRSVDRTNPAPIRRNGGAWSARARAVHGSEVICGAWETNLVSQPAQDIWVFLASGRFSQACSFQSSSHKSSHTSPRLSVVVRHSAELHSASVQAKRDSRHFKWRGHPTFSAAPDFSIDSIASAPARVKIPGRGSDASNLRSAPLHPSSQPGRPNAEVDGQTGAG